MTTLSPLLSQINVSWGMLVVALGLAAGAFAIVAHVLASAPGKRPSWRETLGWSTSLLWAVPVVGVLALVVGRAAPRFQDLEVTRAEVPEPVDIRLHDPDEAKIDAGIVLSPADLAEAERLAEEKAAAEKAAADKAASEKAASEKAEAEKAALERTKAAQADDGVAVAELPGSVAPAPIEPKAAAVSKTDPTDEPRTAKDRDGDSKVKKAARATAAAVKNLIGRRGAAESRKAQDESLKDLPAWAREGTSSDGETTLVVLSSGQHPKLAEAEAEVQEMARVRVRRDFQQTHAAPVEWAVPNTAVRFRLVHEEKTTVRSGNVSFPMFRVHRQLEISPVTREAARGAWREAVVQHRLWGLGSVLGTLGLIVAASAAYLRLDARTQGECRGRLKAAAVGAIVAGGLIAANLV